MALNVSIHIGLPKTGSTALQKALAAHPDELATAGVVYPVALGREDHSAEVAELQIRRTTPTARNRAGYARLERRSVPGAWERLVQRVATIDSRVVVSDESMSSLPAAAARRVVDDLTDASPHQATVVLAVRPLSVLLASAYGQLAQDTVLPSFELWVRAWLRSRLQRTESDASNEWTDGFRVANSWIRTGAQVVCVRYQPDSNDYWDRMLDALGLAGARDRMAIPHANPSMTALGLAAWQDLLRSGVDPHDPETKRLRTAARSSIPELSDTTLGGRLTLTSELAELVDTAFPQPPPGALHASQDAPNERPEEPAQSMARLAERLLDARPLTTQPFTERPGQVAAVVRRIGGLAGNDKW